jgi:DNA-binding MarR family transcriptional regulator
LITSDTDGDSLRTFTKTERGRALYLELGPLMRQRQEFLLNCLTPEQEKTLFEAFDRLEEGARLLEDQI